MMKTQHTQKYRKCIVTYYLPMLILVGTHARKLRKHDFTKHAVEAPLTSSICPTHKVSDSPVIKRSKLEPDDNTKQACYEGGGHIRKSLLYIKGVECLQRLKKQRVPLADFTTPNAQSPQNVTWGQTKQTARLGGTLGTLLKSFVCRGMLWET